MAQTFDGWMVFPPKAGGAGSSPENLMFKSFLHSWFTYGLPREAAQREAEYLCGVDWVELERDGYTCRPVTVVVTERGRDD